MNCHSRKSNLSAWLNPAQIVALEDESETEGITYTKPEKKQHRIAPKKAINSAIFDSREKVTSTGARKRIEYEFKNF